MTRQLFLIKILFVTTVLLFGVYNFKSAYAACTTVTCPPTFSTSTTRHDTFTDVFLDPARIDDFLTRLIASLLGGPILFDQTFDLVFSDPIVQAAVLDAKNLLTGAGALSISGPNLLSSQEDFLGTTTNFLGDQSIGSAQDVTTTTTFGPATILIGEDQSQIFFVEEGTININTNTHTESFFDKQFQNEDSYLLKEHYDLIGRLQTEAAVIPEPGTFLLFSLGIASIGLFRFKK